MNEERDLLAAEYALGLLDGKALARASALAAADPAFAAAVAGWQERLAPLLDEIAGEDPGAELWDRIVAALPPGPSNVDRAANDNGALQRRLRRWRAYSAAVSAVAAALLLVVGLGVTRQAPAPTTQAAAAAPVMVAALSSQEADTSLSVAYDGARSSLLVTPGRMSGAPGHDHELWIIPAGGSPVSLGLVRADAPVRLNVPAAIAPHFRSQSTVALSVEPTGGSPTGQPTGPVVAAGELIIV